MCNGVSCATSSCCGLIAVSPYKGDPPIKSEGDAWQRTIPLRTPKNPFQTERRAFLANDFKHLNRRHEAGFNPENLAGVGKGRIPAYPVVLAFNAGWRVGFFFLRLPFREHGGLPVMWLCQIMPLCQTAYRRRHPSWYKGWPPLRPSRWP